MAYRVKANWSWRMLLRHWIPCALVLALASAGNKRAARMATIAMTTRSSINVNPFGGAGTRDRGARTANNEFLIALLRLGSCGPYHRGAVILSSRVLAVWIFRGRLSTRLR